MAILRRKVLYWYCEDHVVSRIDGNSKALNEVFSVGQKLDENPQFSDVTTVSHLEFVFFLPRYSDSLQKTHSRFITNKFNFQEIFLVFCLVGIQWLNELLIELVISKSLKVLLSLYFLYFFFVLFFLFRCYSFFYFV